MMKTWTEAAGLAAFAFILGEPVLAASARAATCQDMEAEGNSYSVCEARADEDVRLFLRDGGDQPLGTFGAIDATLAGEGLKLAFAMNAGMYHPDRRPVGLYIEKGRELAPLIRAPGPGNFGLQPNGVFCIGDSRFAVVETLAFDAARPPCRFASQSGPMLVLSGQIHPKFLPDSDSAYVRNGVGVSQDGQTAYFVISNDAVNFYTFARFFRDALKVPDALFFDGSISRLYAPDLGRDDFGFAMGPMVGVAVPAE
jgi:uncharacterized protein YigE (DUF2233 family)